MSFFYSSLHFLLKHIILTYRELYTASWLYGSDPCSALHFPGRFINIAVPQVFASQSLSGSTSGDYQTVRPKILSYIMKKKRKPTNVHPEQFSPSSKANTFTNSSTHTHTHSPQEYAHVPADATE